MSKSRDCGGPAGCSADSPIDLVSDDDEVFVRVQVPVAPGPTRVQTTVHRQPVCTYRTRAVTRAQAATETSGIQTRSTLRTGTSVDFGSRAHARTETGDTTTPTGASSSAAATPLQNPNRARRNEAVAATSLWQSPPEAASTKRRLDAYIDNRRTHTQGPTHSKTDRTQANALELASLVPLSGGLLHTRKDVSSKVHIQTSVPRRDLLANELVITDQYGASNGVPKIPSLAYRNALSRARPYGQENLANGGVAPTLVSRQSILTSNTITSRGGDAAKLAPRASGDNLLTRTSMNPNDGAVAASPLFGQLIGRQDGVAQHDSNLRTTLAGTVNKPAAQLSKNRVVPHKGTARLGLQDIPSNMTNDKLSAVWPLRSTDNTLTNHEGNEVPLRGLIDRGKSEEGALFPQPVIEREVATRHKETAISLNMETPQSSLDTSRTQRSLNRILPADRADTRGRAIVEAVRHSRVTLRETTRERRDRRDRRELRPERTHRRRHKKRSDPDVVMITGAHKNFKFWKQQAAKKLQIGPEMKLISAAVAMFDKRQIQTVVPNRYLRTGVPSKNTHRQTLAFPGTVEVLLATPMTAVENAYKEHTADKLDTSRLVLWTDGSAAGSHYSERTRGFAVTWRRSTATGWGRWEAIGFQAQGELPDSSSMETLAVMKAVAKACDLAREMSDQLKTVAIYTDSTSAIHIAQNPNHPLGLHIIRKARILTNFGPTLSLHWCPAHSDVPGNELADKIAGMARSHVYGGNAEFVDLSDDDDDGWEDG